MATISKRTNKSGTYYYLVESARVNGKPRIVKQVYLGTAERIVKAVEQMSPETTIPDPQLVTVYDFGAVTALYSVAQRLGVCQIIDDIAGKRDQGLLNKELEEMGHKMSIRRMLDKFQEAQHVISVFSSLKGNPTIKTGYSRFDGVVNEYANKYGLLQYLV